jgi:hypothetical protein
MIRPFQKSIFNLYGQPHIRNWFYTLAFAIFVSTGFALCDSCLRAPDWFDKPLAAIAGVFIGVTACVTFLRVWQVPPRHTVRSEDSAAAESPVTAAALGSSRGGFFWH